MTTPTTLFLSKEDYQTINKKRLMMYLKTFTKLHNLHHKQLEKLAKIIENHEKRIKELTSEVEAQKAYELWDDIYEN